MPLCVGALEEYISVCCFCGCALKTEEIAARLCGEYQDFIDRAPPQNASLIFCPDCKLKVEQYANDSIQKAWFRMQQLEER